MLLGSKVDGLPDANEGVRQSDHLLMALAYSKWSKILLEVTRFLLLIGFLSFPVDNC